MITTHICHVICEKVNAVADRAGVTDYSPVLDVEISTILQGRAFSITKPFLRKAEHCMGNVAPVSKFVPSISLAIVDSFENVCVCVFGKKGIFTNKQLLI